ncbi:MAG: cytochrome P450 [Acidimicrobiia bacterium]|jgi:cytochrome P450
MLPPPGGLLHPATIQDPHAFHAWLRAEAPVYRVPGTPLFLVSTWDLVTEALGRVDDFSSNLSALIYTGDDGQPALFDMTALGAAVQTLATADPPTHTQHRRAVFPSLVERKMRDVEGYARTVATGLVAERFGGGRVEATAALANPLPMTVLVEVLGLDGADLPTLLDWAFDGTELLAGTNTLTRMAELSVRAGEAGAFLAEQLGAAAPDPDSGVIGAVARGVADGLLTAEEGVGTLVILLGAGGESTTSLIGSAIRILAEQPGLQAALRDDRALVPAFVEEVLRLESPFVGHYRTVRRPAELGGVALEPGDAMLLLWAAANRDGTHFDDPDAVQLDRAHPRDHLGFGRGIHHCVGAPLARMEARLALDALLDGTTAFTLDPARAPAYVPSMFVRRHAHLDLLVA